MTPQISILILAAGSSTRFGGETPKVFLPCGGMSILERSIARLRKACPQAEIILAVHPEHREPFLQPILTRLEKAGMSKVVDGGATRLDSMRNALQQSDPQSELILIHDAARPFFPIPAVHQVLQRGAEVGAALLAIPVPDTLKRVDERGMVQETLDRKLVWLAQTPQVVHSTLLEEALDAHANSSTEITDDVSLVEAMDHPVAVVAGHAFNIKITTPQDLELAELICQMEEFK